MAQVSDIFASPDEQLVAILGNNAAQTFFSTGTVGNGFIVLSDRRVYFRGRCLRRTRRHFSYMREERTVDVGNVTGTGFVHINHVWMKVLAIILAAYGTFGLIFSFIEPELPSFLITFAALGGAALLFWRYKITRKSVFEISFAGGGIGLDVYQFKAGESEFFQKSIKLVGDALKREEKMYGKGTSASAELAQLATLLEKGLITQAEFDAQKSRLLHGI